MMRKKRAIRIAISITIQQKSNNKLYYPSYRNENMNQINTDKKIEDSDINKDTPMKITTSDKNDELNPHDEKQVKESENGKGNIYYI